MIVDVFRDISEQKKVEKQLGYFATHDPMTGLKNRKYFNDELGKALVSERSGQDDFAVLFIDMDRLKDINDTLGHDIGDMVIKEVAARLHRAIGPRDIIARWGGDEFVVMLNNIQTLAEVQRLARKLLNATEPSIRLADRAFHATASIGAAVFPEDGQDAFTLLKNADTALYRAKKAGKNRFELYHHSMHFEAPERLALEKDLRLALKRKEFELYFQPILDLGTGAVTSAETLLRWNHPKLGYLKPGKFINLAEDIGLITNLGRWVLKRACYQLKLWQEKGLRMNLSINVSARQFADAGLAEEVLKIAGIFGCNAQSLEIEMTESVAMDNLIQTQNILKRLSENGIRIVVDDFGTGYSSLSYLKRFPIHKLKIDKSFVHHMMTDEQDTGIIKAIISLAQSLRLKVVAEGVDTAQQLELLKSLGCNEAQGHFISPPLTEQEFAAWIEVKKLN